MISKKEQLKNKFTAFKKNVNKKLNSKINVNKIILAI